MKAAKFLEGFSGKLGEQWIASLMTPAFLFWLGGLLAASDRLGWQTLQNRFNRLNLSEPEEIALLVFALIAVAVSGVVVEQFNFGMLRLLEGCREYTDLLLGSPPLHCSGCDNWHRH